MTNSDPQRRAFNVRRVLIAGAIVGGIAGVFGAIEVLFDPSPGASRWASSGALLLFAVVFSIVRKLRTGRFFPDAEERRQNAMELGGKDDVAVTVLAAVVAGVVGAIVLESALVGLAVGAALLVVGLMRDAIDGFFARRAARRG